MALTFAKKATAAPKNSAVDEDQTEKQASSTQKSTASEQTSSSSSNGASWMMKGAAAKAAIASEDAKAELAKAEKDKLWRFWMPAEEERKLTFLDGNVDADGMLDVFMFYEHSVVVAGDRKQFVCTAEKEGSCPLCDRGDSKPYLVGVLTVIDHTPHKIKKGDNAGKIIKDQKKLFVAKKQTIKQLSKIAVKRGGLAFATFDVQRDGEKGAAVGTQFDFVEKLKPAEFKAKYELKDEYVQPAQLEKEITYRSADELVEMGLGQKKNGPGTEKGVSESQKKSLADEL